MVALASDGRTPAVPGAGRSRAAAAVDRVARRPAAEVNRVLAARPLESAVWAALHDVHDPEIPTISVVDLGVVRSIETADNSIRVEIMPTFVGCPAIEVMRESVADRLREFAADVRVDITFAEPWTTERITPQGRAALRQAGFAPPHVSVGEAGTDRFLTVLPNLPVGECPYCGSRNTSLENAFGPTLCRAIYHCGECSQPFEQFKEV